MADEITIKFGTTNLETNMTVDKISVKEKKSVKTSDIPKSDSSIAETGRRKSLTLTAEGKVYASDYDALRTNLDTLRAALQDGFQKFVKDDDRYVIAQLQDFSEDIERGAMRVVAEYKATFIAHYPFWLSETEHTTTKIIGTDVNSGVGYTINNAGNAPVRVKIEVTAPAGGIADACQIENTTRGELTKYRGTINEAKTLEIDNRYDTDDFEVLNDGVDGHADFEGDFIMLSPGNNTIVFTGVTGATIKIYHRDGWY